MRVAPIIALLALSGMAVVGELYLPLPLLESIAVEYHVSSEAAGMVSSAFGLAYATGFLIFGPLSDRYGRKPVMVLGLLSLAGASAAVAIAGSFETLVGARAVQGLAASSFPPVALAYLSETLPARQRLWGIAWMSTAFLAAGLVGQIYGGVFQGSGLTAALWPAVVFYVLVGLLITQLPAGHTGTPGVSVLRVFTSITRLFANPALVRAYAAAFVVLLSFVAFYVGLDRSRGDELVQAGLNPLTVRAIALPAMLMPLAAASLIKRFGSVPVLVGGLMTAAMSLGAIPMGSELLGPLGFSITFVAGISATVPALIARVGQAADTDQYGMAVAFYTFILFVGASIGPFWPAWASDGGFAGVCFSLAGLLAAVAFLNVVRPATVARPETGGSPT